MRKTYLLAGLSALAFAATGANAQNVNSATSTGNGNTATCTNNTIGSTGNTCTISITGNNDTGTVSQQSNNNTGTITIYGDSNSATINQNGALGTNGSNRATIAIGSSGNGAFGNNASITQPGVSNTATITVAGGVSFSSSRIQQNGSSSTATVTQQAGSSHDAGIVQAGLYNSASVVQAGSIERADVRQNSSASVNATGSGNKVAVTQTGAGTSHDHNQAFADQVGTSNVLTVNQNSTAIHATSDTIQGGEVNTDGTVADGRSGSGNSITVTQGGGSQYSYVEQRAASAGAVNNNTAVVQMGGGVDLGFNGSAQNRSDIIQRSSGNRATAIVFGGSTAGNTSVINQSNTSGNQAATANNEAFVSLSQGNQMASTVGQDGTGNYAEVTMTSGIDGANNGAGANAAEAGRSGGNVSNVNQSNRGNTAVITTGSRAAFQGLGNSVTVNQTGAAAFAARGAARANRTVAADQANGRIGYTEFGRTGTSGNFSGANGNYVETWQQGRFDSATITQTSDANSGVVYSDGDVARARAGVYQSSSVGSVTVNQTGDNYGEVTQAFGQSSSVALTQTDAGDIQTGTNPGTPPTTTTTCDAFGNCTTTTNPGTPATPIFDRAYNAALVTQYGDRNVLTATQNTRNGYLATFQRQGSADNRTVIEQGTGASAAFAGSVGVYAGNPISASPSTGGNTANINANVDQGGSNNANRIWQDGTNLLATVVQLGTGSARATGTDFTGFAANNAGNQVLVTQQGTGNRASAVQRAGVGSSSAGDPASGNSASDNVALTGNAAAQQDEFYFAGGARSAEIDILQGGTNNVASAEQRGRGQYARIDQGPGSGNTASILQDVNATNATAVIRQSGSNNSYYVVQVAPGQYISVEQTGNGNTANNIVQRGAAGGSNGFTPPSGS